jgi:hypothetical protein
VETIRPYTPRGNEDHHQRWRRIARADLLARYGDLHAQGVAQRQAAKGLEVPRSTRQAWRAYQESLDEWPAVVAFFHSPPGRAFLHRLVLAWQGVGAEGGACGMRLVGLLLTLTGLNRFGGASYGTQPQVHRHVEEASVLDRQQERARLAHEMPAKDIT